jgi:hypothetical protein
MRWRSRLLLFLAVFAVQAVYAAYRFRNGEPTVGDAAEVHNIAWNLAHGRGYRFDWDNAAWRKLWQQQNVGGRFDFILNRHGSYPTMFRPPLMPVLVAGILKVVPNYSFFAWRILDAAAFAAAACFLCDAAAGLGQTTGMVVMILILLADPLRRGFVPGWWTEGLAFDFVAVIAWLLVTGSSLRAWVYAISAGLVIGLLCLDRSVFVPLIPFLSLLMAVARPGKTLPRLCHALAILAVSMAVQMPWWVRNVEISGQMMPLGTQGGFNLPDEYGPMAVKHRGVWTGQGMRDALTPPGTPVRLPPGYTEQTFATLWQTPDPNAPDRYFDVMIDRAVCTSLASEIEVSQIGQRAAKDWVRDNYRLIPKLMVEKIWMQTKSERTYLAGAIVIGCVGFWRLRAHRRIILLQTILIAVYVLAIAMTHVVYARFIVPILPPVYVVGMLGILAMIRPVFGRAPIAGSPS